MLSNRPVPSRIPWGLDTGEVQDLNITCDVSSAITRKKLSSFSM